MRQKQSIFSLFLLSPSSRRAWIEIHQQKYLQSNAKVALLAEGVDRNVIGVMCVRHDRRSPSSRRAWIEMLAIRRLFQVNSVALLAEGVDRNFEAGIDY